MLYLIDDRFVESRVRRLLPALVEPGRYSSEPHRSESGGLPWRVALPARVARERFLFVLALRCRSWRWRRPRGRKRWGCRPSGSSVVNELVDRYIASGDITGAVTLVARNGRIVHLQAQGVMDADVEEAHAEGHDVPHRFDVEAGRRAWRS